jgi:pyruvate dehydrogenase E2 component (dihydrolipoamide acetyltransferase)
MAEAKILPIVMPKWGLSMREGKLVDWLIEEGKEIATGQAILDIETDKIAGSFEAPDAGLLRRRVGQPGTVYPVKALLGVIADQSVADKEIDDFVAAYVTPPLEDEGEDSGASRYEFAEFGGLKLRYAKRGEGANTVILIHGFGGDLDNWLFNIDALAERATVYALDLPGHGQSTKAIPDATVAGLARTLLGFMDHVGVKTAQLVGHSLGGVIAMAAAQLDRSRVSSLGLICSAGLGPDIAMNYVDGFIGAQSRRDLKPVLEMLFADASQVSRAMVDDVLKFKRLDGADTALRELAGTVFKDGYQQTVLAEWLKTAAIPSIIVAGAEDKIVPASHSQSAGGEVIAGAGHMVQMEQANRVNALLKQLLAQ